MDRTVVSPELCPPWCYTELYFQDIAPDVEVGQVGIDPPEFGWYVDQREVSMELDAWVDLRRNIIKRPFLATSEKFVDTCG